MKLTEWFDADVKPLLPGVYEMAYGGEFAKRNIDMPIPYHYWTGNFWASLPASSPVQFHKRKKFSRMPDYITYIKSAKWRGLAEDPNGSKP